MASPKRKKRGRIDDEPEGYRIMKNITLPKELWAKVDEDAGWSGRSSVKQVSAILSAYYNRDSDDDKSWRLLMPKKDESANPEIFGGEPTLRNVFLPWPVWDALAEDAAKSRRSLGGQIELILRTYYGGDPCDIDKDFLAFVKVRVSADEPKVSKERLKRRAVKSRR
jgi:hypothetical protein